ncbi:MAG: hypothetical protein M3Y67_01500 [Pseudomonadota bacterium]|nr:hypothetical protein [Pseudomonadota bacterium]
MAINFSNLVDGRVQRQLALEDDVAGHRECVVLTVWVAAHESSNASSHEIRVAGIALLERALETLRRAPAESA